MPETGPKRPRPRVSVVMPVYNEPPASLAESIGSIAEQDFTDFECFVIDESSNPESMAACSALCVKDGRFVRLVPESPLGLAASLNLGITNARGDYVMRIDSDDVCLPGRIAQQVAFLDSNPKIGVLGTALEMMSETGKTFATRSYPLHHTDIVRKMHWTAAIAHPTVMMRRDIVVSCGGYDPSFRYAEDLDLWLRMLNAGTRFANLPIATVKYRQERTNRSKKHWQFNLRARVKNFAIPSALSRVIGIAAIFSWSIIPERAQRAIYALLLLKKSAR